jgi:hypothetical protein
VIGLEHTLEFKEKRYKRKKKLSRKKKQWAGEVEKV